MKGEGKEGLKDNTADCWGALRKSQPVQWEVLLHKLPGGEPCVAQK